MIHIQAVSSNIVVVVVVVDIQIKSIEKEEGVTNSSSQSNGEHNSVYKVWWW